MLSLWKMLATKDEAASISKWFLGYIWTIKKMSEEKDSMIVFLGPSREIEIRFGHDTYEIVVPVNKVTLKEMMDEKWLNKDVLVEIRVER